MTNPRALWLAAEAVPAAILATLVLGVAVAATEAGARFIINLLRARQALRDLDKLT